MSRIVRKTTNENRANGNVKSASRSAKPAAEKNASDSRGKASTKKPTAKKSVDVVKTAAKPRKPVTAKVAKRGSKKVSNLEQTVMQFKTVVNLSREQLERWLNTPESQKLRFPEERNGRAAVHDSGKSVLRILKKRRDQYTEEDLRCMRNVIEFVDAHLAKRPKGDIVASNWRHALMNWGHDPIGRIKRINK